MVNKYRGEVALPIGDATYTLRFSTEAIADLEDATGKTWQEVIEQLNNPKVPRVRLIATLLWAALQEFHPDIDRKAAGRLGMPAQVTPYITEAIQGYKGEEEEKVTEKNPTPQEPNGSAS